jgi:enoyl-CoA hydratase/carnithine racemase
LEAVDGDLLARAVELAAELANGDRQVPAIRREPLTEIPTRLPDVDIGHLSKAVDRVLCQAILEGAAKSLRDGLLVEARCFGAVCGLRDMRIGVDNFLRNGPRSKAPFVHE